MTDDRVRRINSDDELDRALAALHGDVPTDQAQLARARVVLLAAAADSQHAATSPEPVVPLPVRTRRSGRRWLAAAAAVLFLATGGAVTQSVVMDSDTPGSTAAADELIAAAGKVASVTDEPVRPGQYRYVKSRLWQGDIVLRIGRPWMSSRSERVIETWVPADQSKTWLQRRTMTRRHHRIEITEAEARAAGIGIPPEHRSVETLRARCGSFVAATPCTERPDWSNPTPAWIAALPRNPQRLYERLHADAQVEKRGDSAMVEYAAEALRSGRLPSDVRSALYRALAMIPGLVISDRAANLDGRIGIAYGVAYGGSRTDIIVDPRTGQFIGEREVALKDLPGMPSGTVRAYESVSTAVVDRIGRPPR